MRIFLTEGFDEFIHYVGICDELIKSVAHEVDQGLIDGDLGGPLKKKRIALPATGKRGGARSIICVRQNDCLFFLDGWRKKDTPKKGKEIPEKAINIYRLIGNQFLSFTELELEKAISSGILREVK